MSHWHVTRHSEDEDPYISDNLFDVLDYAATELDRLADHEHDFASDVAGRVALSPRAFHGDEYAVHPDEMDEALRSFAKCETYGNLQANAANMRKQSRALIADRAPLYQDDQVWLAPGDVPNPVSKLYKAGLHVVEKINAESPFSIWECHAEMGEWPADDRERAGQTYCMNDV